VSITQSTGQDYNRHPTRIGQPAHVNGWAKARWVNGNNNWGSTYHWYIANNTTYDLTVRYSSSNSPDQNTGEQIMWEGTKIYVSSAPGSVSGRTITMAAATGGLTGQIAMITAGKGVGQSRRVESATTGSFVVERAFDIQPDSTSKITVSGAPGNVVVYQNLLQGKSSYLDYYSASAGVNVFQGGNDFVIDHNTFRKVRYAVFLWTFNRDERQITVPVVPQLFNQVTHNTMDGVARAVDFISEGFYVNSPEVFQMGHTVYDNSISNVNSSGISWGVLNQKSCVMMEMFSIEKNRLGPSVNRPIIEWTTAGVANTCYNILQRNNTIQ
jgi:hypothetical protein